MKEKIVSALKTEYKGLGLGDKTIDRLASYVEGLVEKEDDIATAVKRDDVKLIATSIQGEIDGIRKAKQAAEDALEEYKKSHPDTSVVDDDKDKETEAARKLREQIEALTARLDKQDKEEQTRKTLNSAIETAKTNGCTNSKALALTQRLFSLKENETTEDAAKRFEEEYNKVVKDYFSSSPTPYGGGDSLSEADEKTFHKALSDFADGKGFAKKEGE